MQKRDWWAKGYTCIAYVIWAQQAACFNATNCKDAEVNGAQVLMVSQATCCDALQVHNRVIVSYCAVDCAPSAAPMEYGAPMLCVMLLFLYLCCGLHNPEVDNLKPLWERVANSFSFELHRQHQQMWKVTGPFSCPSSISECRKLLGLSACMHTQCLLDIPNRIWL